MPESQTIKASAAAKASSVKGDRMGSSLPERLSFVVLAALLTFFTTQLCDLVLFGGRPAFSDTTFLWMNIVPLLLVGVIGALLDRVWLVALIVTAAGLAFALTMVGFSHGFERRALAQYFMYGTVFLWNALFFDALARIWASAKENLET